MGGVGKQIPSNAEMEIARPAGRDPRSGRGGRYLDSLGMALLQSGKLDDALSTYDQAIAKTPLAASYIGRAIIYARKGDSSRAKAELEKAKKLNAGIEGQFAGYGLKL